VVKSLNVSALVYKEANGRNAKFVALDAPAEATEATSGEKGIDRVVFREHDPARIVNWFNRVAWQYRVSKAGDKDSEKEKTFKKPRKDKKEKDRRESDVLDTPIDVPSYYSSEDPVRELPPGERNELLDWLSAITGQPIRDDAGRFQGASRVEIANLLSMMHQFGKLSDGRSEARYQEKNLEKAADITKLMVTLDENIKDKINQYTRGRTKDFSLKDFRRESIKKRKLETEERETSRGRSVVFLKIILDLFGKEAANDLVIRNLAQGPLGLTVPCSGSSKKAGKSPASESSAIDLADFFRIRGDTIVHDDNVAREFAAKTGAHSECVARRVARDLWEMKKAKGDSGRSLERQDQVALAICTSSQYKVPCPQRQETELRSRIGYDRDAKPIPVYEAWARVARTASPAPKEELEEIRAKQIAEELSEEVPGRAAPRREFNENPRDRSYKVNGAVAMVLPSPIQLLMLVVYG
jgi:hypothetical protein